MTQTTGTFRHLLVRMVGFDLTMGIIATVGWLFSLGVREPGKAIILCAFMYGLHLLAWIIPLAYLTAPLTTWEQRGETSTDTELLDADRALNRISLRLALAQGPSWLLYYFGIVVIAWFWLPDTIGLGLVEFQAMGFILVTVLLGPPLIMYPLISLLLEHSQARVSTQLSLRQLGAARELAPMAKRMQPLAITFVLSLGSWQAYLQWTADGQHTREASQLAAQLAVSEAAAAIGDGVAPEPIELRETDELPDSLLVALSEDTAPGQSHSTIEIRREKVRAAARLPDGRWAFLETEVEFDRSKFWMTTLSTTLAAVCGLLICLAGILRLLTLPLERLRSNLRQLIEFGKLDELSRVPVIRHDEIGLLTHEFNRMVDVFDELAAAARAVSAGDLRIEITGKGDLQDAFRSMVARLAELVVQIRNAAIEVASASAEIQAATQGQEQSASEQSAGIGGIKLAMQELSKSALNIANGADEVLLNAEQTRARSDEVVTKIAELGLRIMRVGELLELIREVADRSDLLALNGSLEATRAGEAGRGFALVSTELRRLAERVTGTVSDVRDTINSVDAANQSTAMATEDNRALAEGTTEVARHIVEITGIQSAGTNAVSTGIDEIADLISSSAAATSQTRAAAKGLRQRALQLEGLIEHFIVVGESD